MKHRLSTVLLLSLALPAAVSAQTTALKTGEQVYRETCMACHGAGVDKAPRLGDLKVWAQLHAEGQQVVTAHGWVGVRGMPPQGGRPDLRLEEFARALARSRRRPARTHPGRGGQAARRVEAAPRRPLRPLAESLRRP